MAFALSGRSILVLEDFVKGSLMDLGVWLPAMFILGLVGLGLLFAFVAACERV
jgi:hypothetical protein